jgi:hypothetical protein
VPGMKNMPNRMIRLMKNSGSFAGSATALGEIR